jgi:hypothetical protein
MNQHAILFCILLGATGAALSQWEIADSPIGGFAVSARSEEVPLLHSVHFSPQMRCAPVYSYTTGNPGLAPGNRQSEQPLRLEVDDKVRFLVAPGQDLYVTPNALAVYIHIAQSELPEAMRRGTRLLLKGDDGHLMAAVSLKGFAPQMSSALQQCLAASQAPGAGKGN